MTHSSSAASARMLHLLQWEVANIQRYLDYRFDPPSNGERRTASLASSAEYIVVRNFPLPDGYSPDYVDLLVLTDSFPAVPPIGLYLLNGANASRIAQISKAFNTFQDKAFHTAPSLRGYTWVCFSYASNAWRYRSDAPARGDNVGKFLASFFAELTR